MNIRRLVLLLLSVLLVCACDQSQSDSFKVIARFPHDPAAYTQGLLFHDGVFFESTGLFGQSSLRRVNPDDGKVLQQRSLARHYFGEGLALVKGVLIQLTWKAGKAFTYNSSTLEPIGEFSYDTEGWGLAYDGQALVMSDGSDILVFRDPATFRKLRELKVRENGTPVRYLNELEVIDGIIWANVYQTDFIVRIDPATGEVIQRIDLSGLLAFEDRHGREDVLNGIAFDPAGRRLFVTGKRYAYIYEIEIITSASK